MRILNTDLDQRITIEEQTEKFDDIGGYKKQWHEIYSLWARVESLFNRRHIGNEVAFSKQLRSVHYYEFLIRYQNGINTKMRVFWNNKVLHINKVIDMHSKRRFLLLIGEEKI